MSSMKRGNFEFLRDNRHFEASHKIWLSHVVETASIWYRPMVFSDSLVDFRSSIVDYFRSFRESHNQIYKNNFVYFISRRKRVRFVAERGCAIFDFNNEPAFSLYVEVGAQREAIQVIIPVDFSMYMNVEIDPHLIRLWTSENSAETILIHDFLQMYEVNLDISSHICYVGQTCSPEKRPTNGEHRGLSDALYRIKEIDDERFDLFIYQSMFSINTVANNDADQISMYLRNDMIYSTTAKDSAEFIEKMLIYYFRPESQEINMENELNSLRNFMISFESEHDVGEFILSYEINSESDYYMFGSQSVEPSNSHTLKFELNEGKNIELREIKSVWS